MQLVEGFIFDLDGTLLSSALNFRAIREQINCPPEQDILSFIAGLSADNQGMANKIVIEHEIQDAHRAVWIEGARQVIQTLQTHKIPVAIVTRNSKEATWTKLNNNNLMVDIVLTREDAPPKPNPRALLDIAEQWHLPVQNLIYIGDYLYDVQAANNAGMIAGLYAPEGEPDYAHLADWLFKHFDQLNQMLSVKLKR